MISTQRLIMIIIGINLIMGLIGSIYKNPTLYNDDFIDNEQNYYEKSGNDFKDDDPYTGVKNQDYIQENSIGNSLSWGKILLDIFLGSINPFSFSKQDFDTNIEKIAVQVLGIFRSLMSLLIIIEVIMFFKNKKSS